MNDKRLTAVLSPVRNATWLALLVALFPCTPWAQSTGDDQSRKQFAGTWKGTCEDGNPFVVLTLQMKGSELVGDISIANMNGSNGQCMAVLDPPSPEHAMKITEAKAEGKTLIFQGSPKARFEMSLEGANGAKLKFFGTPAESTPWQLTKSAETSR